MELSVADARDHFSQCVNRAAFGDEITYVTRGRKHERVAAIVPIELATRSAGRCGRTAETGGDPGR